MSTQKQTRLSVNINSQSRDALRKYATRHALTITEAVRRHIGVADFVINEIESGKQLCLKGRSGIEVVTFDFLDDVS